MVDAEAERRLVAILCADVAGYSRLMGVDEDGTLSALARLMDERVAPVVAGHRGRIFKTTGDGFLAEFPSPVEAVRAALEIVGGEAPARAASPEAPPLRLKIGLTLGDVVVRGSDLFGDAVNVAARLQAIAEPDSVLASAAVHEQVGDRVAARWTDLGDKSLKNIARPVRVYRVTAAERQSRRTLPNFVSGRRARAAAVLTIAALAIVGALVGWQVWQRWESDSPALAPEQAAGRGVPTIAVLPFVNRSDETVADYFSDGVTEDLINALGRFSSLSVIAFGATLPYKGKALSPIEISRALGVRYLVEGSVRRAGDRVRVTARLSEAESGTLLWSEQFDEELKDIFTVQETISRRVAGTLAASLTRIEARRALAKPPGNLDAYDLVLRGRENILRATRSANREARAQFERAIALDPGYAAAYAGLGSAYYEMVSAGWTEFPDDIIRRAEEQARRALALDDSNIDARRALSRIYGHLHQHDRALAEADQALKNNPSDAESHLARAAALLWLGRIEESVSASETAARLNPQFPPSAHFIHGLALYSTRRYADAIPVIVRGLSRYPENVFLHATAAAAYAQLGSAEDAALAVAAVRRLNPFFDAEQFGSQFGEPAYHAHVREGLAKAGLQ